MSFDVNIGRSEPVIKAAANMNNDGGSGGNTGYMMSGGRQKKDQRKSLFDNSNGGMDSFELSSKLPKHDIEMPDEGSWITRLLKKIK